MIRLLGWWATWYVTACTFQGLVFYLTTIRGADLFAWAFLIGCFIMNGMFLTYMWIGRRRLFNRTWYIHVLLMSAVAVWMGSVDIPVLGWPDTSFVWTILQLAMFFWGLGMLWLAFIREVGWIRRRIDIAGDGA